MRPDVLAFRELDAIVRRLTEQLAGYRRRALSAELRARELEREGAALQAALDTARMEAASALESRDHALAAAREATAASRTAQDALVELERTTASSVTAGHDAGASTPAPASGAKGRKEAADETATENARLRARLSEARERTVQLADRVRFLRQQLMQGAER